MHINAKGNSNKKVNKAEGNLSTTSHIIIFILVLLQSEYAHWQITKQWHNVFKKCFLLLWLLLLLFLWLSLNVPFTNDKHFIVIMNSCFYTHVTPAHRNAHFTLKWYVIFLLRLVLLLRCHSGKIWRATKLRENSERFAFVNLTFRAYLFAF